MRKLLHLLLLLPIFLMAEIDIPIQSKGSGGNFVGPTLKTQVSKDFCFGGVGGIFEAGFRQIRANGTLGFALGSEKRDGIKGSVDYLTQELKYNFISGSERRWIHQLAGGLAYQHVFDINILKDFIADGYYSHSWSRDLGEKQATAFILGGEEAIFEIKHRIAGADAWGLGSGVDLQIFSMTSLGLKLNYDHVDYDTNYSKDLTKAGVGGTVSLTQMFPQNIALSLLAGFRKPFNYYSGSLSWSPKQVSGLSVGVFGDHTAGKHRLASSYDLGVSLSYAFGPKGGYAKKGKERAPEHCNSLVGGWLVQPAVYMPQVLAVADQKVTGNCFTLFVEGPSILTILIPNGFAIQSSFTITEPFETSPTSVTYILYDANGNELFNSGRAGLGPTNSMTFPIPPGIDPASISRITLENTSQYFQFSCVVCQVE